MATIFWIALIFAVSTGIGLIREYNFVALRWPAKMGFYSLRRRVGHFMRRHGWAVDRWTSGGFEFIMRNRGGPFAVHCYPSDLDTCLLAAKDFVADWRTTRQWVFVVITADPIEANVILMAHKAGAYIFHYKSLGRLACLPIATRKNVGDLCEHIAREDIARSPKPFGPNLFLELQQINE